MSIPLLPELWPIIGFYLSPYDLFTLRRVNKNFHSLLYSDVFWKNLVSNYPSWERIFLLPSPLDQYIQLETRRSPFPLSIHFWDPKVCYKLTKDVRSWKWFHPATSSFDTLNNNFDYTPTRFREIIDHDIRQGKGVNVPYAHKMGKELGKEGNRKELCALQDEYPEISRDLLDGYVSSCPQDDFEFYLKDTRIHLNLLRDRKDLPLDFRLRWCQDSDEKFRLHAHGTLDELKSYIESRTPLASTSLHTLFHEAMDAHSLSHMRYLSNLLSENDFETIFSTHKSLMGYQVYFERFPQGRLKADLPLLEMVSFECDFELLDQFISWLGVEIKEGDELSFFYDTLIYFDFTEVELLWYILNSCEKYKVTKKEIISYILEENKDDLKDFKDMTQVLERLLASL